MIAISWWVRTVNYDSDFEIFEKDWMVRNVYYPDDFGAHKNLSYKQFSPEVHYFMDGAVHFYMNFDLWFKWQCLTQAKCSKWWLIGPFILLNILWLLTSPNVEIFHHCWYQQIEIIMTSLLPLYLWCQTALPTPASWIWFKYFM